MRTAPLPPDLAPADLTLAQADELLETTLQLPRKLGRHPEYDDESGCSTADSVPSCRSEK